MEKALIYLGGHAERLKANIVACVPDEILTKIPAERAEKAAVILRQATVDAGFGYLKEIPVVDFEESKGRKLILRPEYTTIEA
jgi:hypothetical protein